MKRIIIILFLFIFILATGYGIYYFWDKKKSLDVWSMVPENTILVYENTNLINSWNQLQNNPIWVNLLNIDKFKSIKANFESLDSLSGGNGTLDEIFRNNRLLISLNITAKDDFDFIFYQSIENTDQLGLINKIENNFNSLKKSVRVYENNKIYELKSQEAIFSYSIIRGNFIGSFSPILLEDVIRNLEKENTGFREKNDEIFKVASFQNDIGNVYFNLQRLERFSKVFAQAPNQTFEEIISQFAGATFLDFVLDQSAFYLNGFTFPNDSVNFLSIYKNQVGGDITLENYIPGKTAMLLHERFSNAAEWQANVLQFWKNKSPEYLQERRLKAEGYAVDFTEFHQFMAGENAMAILNSTKATDESDKLIFIKMLDKNEGLNKINNLSEQAVKQLGDTLYYEQYAEKEIRELAINEFPKWLLGPNYSGFKHTFFTTFDDFLVMSNNIQSLKSLMLDIETENTWGKIIRHNRFLESTLQESNLNLLVNTAQAWPLLVVELNDKWRLNFQQNEKAIKNLDMLAFQFSYENERYYTNIEVSFQDNKIENELKLFDKVFEIDLNSPIISKPFVVRNHNTGLFETLIQDSLNNLHLISTNGDVIWTESIDDKIISDIFQVDYYKNNKLQYAFATEKSIYLFDRNGVAMENFPIKIGNSVEPIQYFNVIDYDKSKDYRFIITKQNANIYLTDKFGKPLGDWNPLKLGDKIVANPQHIRIRSKDFMVVMQENGTINVMSRNGQMKPNFPTKLNNRLSDNLFFEIGNNFETSFLVSLTNSGELVKVSMDGKTQQKQQLYMPNKETIFKIIPDASERSYLMARQDLNRMSLLKPSGEALFEKDYLSQEEMSIQYYQIGIDKELVAITDHLQDFTYIYTKEGQLINQQPIESEAEIALIYFNKDNVVHIYKCHENKFSVLKFTF